VTQTTCFTLMLWIASNIVFLTHPLKGAGTTCNQKEQADETTCNPGADEPCFGWCISTPPCSVTEGKIYTGNTRYDAVTPGTKSWDAFNGFTMVDCWDEYVCTDDISFHFKCVTDLNTGPCVQENNRICHVCGVAGPPTMIKISSAALLSCGEE
jgi:hypothetical protein